MKYIIFLFTFFSSLLFSQWPGSSGGGKQMPAIGVLSGTILDSSTTEPLEYASISLINTRSKQLVTGGLSDEKGNFYIKEIPLGPYMAVIEFVGYKKKEIEPVNLFPNKGGPLKGGGIEQSLGKILLPISSINLTEVEVLGESQFIQTIDKQVFTVGKNLASTGGSGEDVLRQVPTVDVDIDGNITLRGDANVTILIDGKKVGFDRRTMVDNLQASMIKKVEVITNPSAKYDPDGVGGIINLVLKRGAFEGLNGSTTLAAGQYNKNNIAGNLNYRSDKFNLFSSSSLRTGERLSLGSRSYTFNYFNPPYINISGDDSIRYLSQETERRQNDRNISFRFGGDLYLNKVSSVSYTGNFNNGIGDKIENIKWTLPTNDTLEISESEDEYNWGHSISYENKFDSQDKNLNINLDYNLGYEQETENSEEVLNEVLKSQLNDAIIFMLDFEDKLFEKVNIETGIKATLKDVNDSLNFLNDDYLYNYEEDIYAFYSTLGFQLSDRIGLKGGLRYEQVNTKASVRGDTSFATGIVHYIINNEVGRGEYINPYSKLYPSMFISYQLTDRSQIQFGYSKRVNRPGLRSLNPFPRTFLDETRIRSGNPFTKPEFSDVAEINFSSNSRKINFNTGISYKLTDDAIAWWDRDEIIYEGESYELLTSGNAEKAQNLGGSIVINYRPIPLISTMLTTWWWSSKTTGGQYENDMTGSSLGMFNRGQLTFNIPNFARIEISAGGRAKMKITSGTIPASYGADIGIEKSFLNKAISVTLKVNDLFDSRKFTLDTEQDYTDYTQLLYADRKRDRRTASINIRYNFGKQQKKRWDGRRFSRGGGSGGGMDMDY